ncbi:hypothetical protein KW792_00985 [Candidatus Saccharibacteria bacterium]|nr:hypothetical protein [Candidatus Saccharibacteria bacterium]
MPKHHNIYKQDGFRFQGNSIHRDELAVMNAGLSLGRVPMTIMELAMARPDIAVSERPSREIPFKSRILDRLKDRIKEDPDFVPSLARLAMAGGELPSSWRLDKKPLPEAAGAFRIDLDEFHRRLAAERNIQANAA